MACIIVTLVSRRAQLSIFSLACDLLDGKESTLEEAWLHVGYKGLGHADLFAYGFIYIECALPYARFRDYMKNQAIPVPVFTEFTVKGDINL